MIFYLKICWSLQFNDTHVLSSWSFSQRADWRPVISLGWKSCCFISIGYSLFGDVTKLGSSLYYVLLGLLSTVSKTCGNEKTSQDSIGLCRLVHFDLYCRNQIWPSIRSISILCVKGWGGLPKLFDKVLYGRKFRPNWVNLVLKSSTIVVNLGLILGGDWGQFSFFFFFSSGVVVCSGWWWRVPNRLILQIPTSLLSSSHCYHRRSSYSDDALL